jgi:beta-glucosidase
MPVRRFPGDFLLGAATAAHQVEGCTDNDWTRWALEDPARIADRSDASIACDHFRRYRKDLEQLAALHQNAHRFSIEWSRVEPQPACFDRSALDHYADVIRTCRRLGMTPIVTLQHFTLPCWIADGGGVLRPDAPRLFARYVAACAEAFGEDVGWWLTINEPAVLAVQGFALGAWPPGKRSLGAALAALRGMLRMHAAGARALHEVARRRGWDARVSIAHHERRLRPRRARAPIDRVVAAIPDYVFNRLFLHCCRSGRLLPPLGAGRIVPGLRDSLDYIGVNYYCEDVVSLDARAPQTLFTRQYADPSLPQSSFGWAIDPAGLRRGLNNLWREFQLPLLVTENGVADEHDELRPAYVVDHLNAVLDAIDDGVDVRGYMHWTAWDNFEWAEGYTKKFGLFSVDHATQERTAKPSAALYAEICAARALAV